jgi:hypothetical protein
MKEFILTDDQVAKVLKFHPKHKKIYTGAISGGDSYTFMPTGLGCIITYKCKCGRTLDLTESENW